MRRLDRGEISRRVNARRLVGLSNVFIKKEFQDKKRDQLKREIVLVIEANAIKSKVDISKFVNVSTGKSLGGNSHEDSKGFGV